MPKSANKVITDIKSDDNKTVAVAKVAKSAVRRNPSKSSNSKMSTNRLELLITVVNRKKSEFYQDLLLSFEVNFQTAVNARGTASMQMLSLLGLEDAPKTVIFSFIREDKIQDALATLENKFQTIKDGRGVAYTVPLSSVIGVTTYGFLSNVKTVKEEKNE